MVYDGRLNFVAGEWRFNKVMGLVLRLDQTRRRKKPHP